MKKIFLLLLIFCSPLMAQPDGKSLQTSQIEKTPLGFNLLIKPIKGHHFNLEAPTRVKKDEQEVTPLSISPQVLTLSLKADEKCDLHVETYICDDKKTFCAPQNSHFKCLKLVKTKSTSVQSESVKAEVASTAESLVQKKSSRKTELFIVNDPKMAVDQAKKQGKPLLIDFFGTWCPPCNILDETVFNRPAFKNLSKDFILLKLDVDQKISWELKSKFAVKGYPTVVLATTENEEISRFVGAIPESEIIKMMKHAIKSKNTSLARTLALFQTKPTPKAALEITESLVRSEDYVQAQIYVAEAFKNPNLNLSDKEMLLLIPLLATPKDKYEHIAKSQLPFLKSLFESYPVSDLYLTKLELLEVLAEKLKDETLKKWIHETNIKNIKNALSQPKLNLSSLTKMDLMSIRTESFENLEQGDNIKKSYSEMASEYTKLIISHKQNPNTNRGYNLERVYCLYKSGAVQESRAEYEKLITVYPYEFTFHYNYASVLKDLKEWDSAYASALKALQYSYGDNQLRAIYLVSEIESKKGLKKDSLERLTKAIDTTELPKDESVRTHRYVKRLVELKSKIQNDKTM